MFKLIVVFIVFSISAIIAKDIPKIRLNNGQEMPQIGLGTIGTTEEAVLEAIADGYRHFDTSLDYKESEITIGRALKKVFAEGKVKRQDLFIVSKLEKEYHERKNVPVGIKKSLANLGIDYLDLYLIHHPESGSKNIDLIETWLGMTDVLHANLTKSIGVSNFAQAQLEHIMENGKNVVPVTNQVICNPYINEKELLAYQSKHDITLTAYSPLGGTHYPNLLKDPKLIQIGVTHNVSSAQVALKYQIQRNVIVIPDSVNPKYIKENLDLFGFSLSEQEMKDIDSLNKVK